MKNPHAPIQMPLTVSRVSPVSLQDQIYGQIKQQITSQCLRSEVRLPSIRELSQQLNVSLNTVKLAYEQLLSEGYLVTSKGRGTFVARSRPDEYLFSGLGSTADSGRERHASRFPPTAALATREPLIKSGRSRLWISMFRFEAQSALTSPSNSSPVPAQGDPDTREIRVGHLPERLQSGQIAACIRQLGYRLE